jgi:hypothetical protein
MIKLIVLVSILLVADNGRYAQVSPEIKEWFNTLRSQKGVCCSIADGFSVDDPEWGHTSSGYWVRVNSEWVDVPEDAVVSGGNRIGRAIVWPIITKDGKITIRCFLPGAEG